MSRQDDYERAWANDPHMRRWVTHVLNDMAPKMAESALVCQLVPSGKNREGDVKFWVELGASIMMNKPIVAVAFDGQEVPEKLRLVADEIVYLPNGMGPEAADQIQAAIGRVMKEME